MEAKLLILNGLIARFKKLLMLNQFICFFSLQSYNIQYLISGINTQWIKPPKMKISIWSDYILVNKANL